MCLPRVRVGFLVVSCEGMYIVAHIFHLFHAAAELFAKHIDRELAASPLRSSSLGGEALTPEITLDRSASASPPRRLFAFPSSALPDPPVF